ncbi:MAG: hypothetical protein GEU96_04040 [Propionibacteriales bacterium]|nr:hypothetical protein [Propionibacteriales bacterium]
MGDPHQVGDGWRNQGDRYCDPVAGRLGSWAKDRHLPWAGAGMGERHDRRGIDHLQLHLPGELRRRARRELRDHRDDSLSGHVGLQRSVSHDGRRPWSGRRARRRQLDDSPPAPDGGGPVSTETDPQTRSDGRRPPNPAPRAMSLGHDLPRMPRRYGQWAGAVLFVIMAVLLAGWFWQQKSDRQAVLVIAEPVAAGAVITSEDLDVVEVSGVRGAIPSVDSGSVVGSTAAVGLVDGQILTRDMVTTDPLPGPGERVVGLQLDATRAPAGLMPGDTVVVLAVPPAGDPSTPGELDAPTVLAPSATVASATAIEGAGTRLTLLVPEPVAERVTAYVAAGRVAVVQAPIGGDE